MPNFERSKIYAIKSPSTSAVYIGSTTEHYLSQRFGNHKAHYKLFWEGLTGWCASYYILGFDDSYIELIESYPCKSIDELRKREREVIMATKNCCNIMNPYLIVDDIEDSQYRANMAYRKRNVEKAREWNRKNQQAWRDRQKAKKLAQTISCAE